MSKVKLAILEDERLLARDLKMRLTEMGYEVIASLHSHSEALEYLKTESEQTDLMIVDIELDGKMDGIEVGELIHRDDHFPFVYLTSHTEEDVVTKARQTKPSAYLTKPFREKEIQIAIDLAISNFAEGRAGNEEADKSDAYIINDSFFIKKKFKYEKVRVEDILFAEAQRNYTLIKTKLESYLLSQTLKTVIDRLAYPYFVQSHRSYLLNLNHITAFEGNRIFIDDNEIPVSKNYRESVFNRFRTF